MTIARICDSSEVIGVSCACKLATARNIKILNIHKIVDIIVSAIGVPNFLKRDMVKENAIIIDVGINRVDDSSAKKGYKIVGDVDLESMIDKVSYITPVPGGVGPMTIAMLLYNTVVSAESNLG